jgi:(1->4)-alpha-D-glucan 1-alpha-D-glucosylmutase
VAELRCLYRLQLLPHLDFGRARELVPYLRDLGVSHLYLSPVMQARRGSTHGYDVADPTRVSEELGGEAGLRSLCTAASDAGLGVVLDVVPNHMAAIDENPFWADTTRRARFFDWEAETGWYRRFFDVGELGGVRVEDDEVFEATHARALELVREGLVDGLRIDHVDGLVDPRGYLERLRAEGVGRVWVEKIVERGERLRPWPVEGTTGYEFANDVARLFVDPAAEAPLTELYAELTGIQRPYEQVAFEAKFQEAQTTFAPECDRLRRELGEPFPELERALASFTVYRTYVEPWSGRVDDADREAIARAELPERLARVLLLEERGLDGFVTRFQQTTGPVVAKGVEDTAFYRYNRFVALNQVGGDPGAWSVSLDAFHRANRERAESWPHSLLTTHTHDAKRSGDVTARLVALSGMADEWADAVGRWRELTAHLRPEGAPDGNEEYLVFQVLVGAWPIGRERLLGFVEKALREAKTNTSWVAQNVLWEAAVKVFCFGLYDEEPFRRDFEPFAARVAGAGRRFALGQLLLKLTSPGVPDVYQGDELELLQLVDPDNRGPVDWDVRRRALASVHAGADPTTDSAKLHVLVRALAVRAERPETFASAYEPLDAGDGICAFRRGGDVAVVVPIRPGASKGDVRLGAGWRDVLPELPVGLLVRRGAYATAA